MRVASHFLLQFSSSNMGRMAVIAPQHREVAIAILCAHLHIDSYPKAAVHQCCVGGVVGFWQLADPRLSLAPHLVQGTFMTHPWLYLQQQQQQCAHFVCGGAAE